MSDQAPLSPEYYALLERYACEPTAANLAAVEKYTHANCSAETQRHVSACLSTIATQESRIDELRKINLIMAQNSGPKFGDVGRDVIVQQGDHAKAEQSTNLNSPHHNGGSGGIWGAIKTLCSAVWIPIKKWLGW